MTCVTRDATRAGSEEGRLSSQAMKLLVVDYLLCLPSPDSLPFEIKNVVMTTLKRRFFLSPIFTHSLLFSFFVINFFLLLFCLKTSSDTFLTKILIFSCFQMVVYKCNESLIDHLTVVRLVA